MADNLDKHESTLEGLREEFEALKQLIDAYETYLATKRGLSNQGQLPLGHDVQNGHSSSEVPITLYDGSERILRSYQRPLHVSVLVRELAKMGKITTGNSLTGALAQDKKKRFERVRPATFGLTEWSKKHDGA